MLNETAMVETVELLVEEVGQAASVALLAQENYSLNGALYQSQFRVPELVGEDLGAFVLAPEAVDKVVVALGMVEEAKDKAVEGGGREEENKDMVEGAVGMEEEEASGAVSAAGEGTLGGEGSEVEAMAVASEVTVVAGVKVEEVEEEELKVELVAVEEEAILGG